MYCSYGCERKKSLILLEDMVRMANVLVLSNSTSLMGRGMASSGLEVAMTVLKYWKSSQTVILKGRLVQMILRGWNSAMEYFSFSSSDSQATLYNQEFRACSLILSSSMAFLLSCYLFFFFFFFFSFQTIVPYSSFEITLSRTIPSLPSNRVNSIALINNMKQQIFQQQHPSRRPIEVDSNPSFHPIMIQQDPEHFRFSSIERYCTEHRRQRIIGICLSPQCENYRQLCKSCKVNHHHPTRFYKDWSEGVGFSKERLNSCLTQLRVIRQKNQQNFEQYVQNSSTMNYIEQTLNKIKERIIWKVDVFKQNLQKQFKNKVRDKISYLDHLISQSQKALDKRLKQFETNQELSLSSIFTQDLKHLVNFYQSSYIEIFNNKIKNFQSSLNDDRIMTLMVNFEQNLQKIFNYHPKTISTVNHRSFHFFRNQGEQNYIYSLSHDLKNIDKRNISPEYFVKMRDYNWKDTPQSIFSETKNCYFIFGEGNASSSAIVKWDYSKDESKNKSQFSEEPSFKQIREMKTERRFFGVCQLRGEIYIIGGENDSDGCLARCQKLVPSSNYSIYIIDSLNNKSSRHSLTTYKDKFILKFGGITKYVPEGHKIINFDDHNAAPCEIYSLDSEEWKEINFKRKGINTMFGLWPSVFKIENHGKMLILGGEMVKEKALISASFEENENEDIKVKVLRFNKPIRDIIYNQTVYVDEQNNQAIFLKHTEGNQEVKIDKMKLNYWN